MGHLLRNPAVQTTETIATTAEAMATTTTVTITTTETITISTGGLEIMSTRQVDGDLVPTYYASKTPSS